MIDSDLSLISANYLLVIANWYYFFQLDAFRLRLCSDQIISLNKINYKNEISGILLVTPSAIMFDPTQNLPELGLIIPINDIKRLEIYV